MKKRQLKETEDNNYKDKEQLPDYISHIGSDESGKGDFFGPLVVCSCFVDETTAPLLLDLGVKDSKTISDKKILALAKEIGKLCPLHIVTIMPSRYNELYTEFRNLNSLLTWAHLIAIEELTKQIGPQRVLVDSFSKSHPVTEGARKKGFLFTVEERVRAEEDLAVAAASCIARAQFILSMESLSKKAGVTLHKGAGDPVEKMAAYLLETIGEKGLLRFAKLHFKTLDKVKKKINTFI